ncbi:glycogen debranching protein GlgX [Thauera sp.]|jgi:glycogen operon protein|uniref:glycogen debranching protein GlgX n=1 Tax=Thauera sp. TaxID=1905334 RepID=UPI001B539DB8|nr:glycogen debranching protein GlgX [Thauera sp.]MBP6132714.1 glycogen debranching protein GlgX [Thauera sp.]MBP7048854.1 glycogen debranching protein GlgX [Thauera sp.]
MAHALPDPDLRPGQPWPLGATLTADSGETGVNFAVWSPDAEAIELCLFDAAGREALRRLALPACSEGVWHGFLPAGGVGLVYGLRAHGPWAPGRGHWFNPAKLLLDPWAQEVVGSYGRQQPGAADDVELAARLAAFRAARSDDPRLPDPRDNAAFAPKARVLAPAPAPARDRPPRPHIPRERTVLYEAHVRALTMRHPDIPPALRGSYAALAHPLMLEHYRALGITTLSLLPLHFRADEAALQRRGLTNHWGYAPAAWLAPEPRYASGRPGTSAADELAEAIDALHAAGFEVVLDVVFNHTAELDADGPMLSLRGLANARAYHLDPQDPACYRDWSGCGNAVNLGEPRMLELVVGALRHWATRYRVDGFRLDLAVTTGRDRRGHFEAGAALFAAIAADPSLAHLKWIAEPWDLGPDGYRLGGFAPGWMEWNDRFRDTMRSWWLCGGGDRGTFAHRFAGSAAEFDHDRRAPTASINFLCAHDGFGLRDLVSHDHRHNQANGEHNRDGHAHNHSWNCGVEGATDDPAVLALRARLQRALLASLLLAQGTPMLLAGDELGHSQGGNNNAYCQDNATTWLDWAAADRELLACARRLLALRAAHPALRQAAWLRGPEHGEAASVRWLRPDGAELQAADWNDPRERALAILLHPPGLRPHTVEHIAKPAAAAPARSVLLLVNPAAASCRFRLPAGAWSPVFDSARADGSPALPAPGHESHPVEPVLSARTVLVLLESAQHHQES